MQPSGFKQINNGIQRFLIEKLPQVTSYLGKPVVVLTYPLVLTEPKARFLAGFSDQPRLSIRSLFSLREQWQIRRSAKAAEDLAQQLEACGRPLTIEEKMRLGCAHRDVADATLIKLSNRAMIAHIIPGINKDEKLQKKIDRVNGRLYGMVDRQRALACLAILYPTIDSLRPEVAARYARRYPFINESCNRPLPYLRPAESAHYRHLLSEYFGSMLEAAFVGETIDTFDPAVDIPRVVRKALVHLKARGWTATYNGKRRAMAVSSRTKRVESGKRVYKPSRVELEALLLHEVGVHALRSINGSRLHSHLLAFGLPHFLDAEEGLGLLFEQIWLGKAEPTKLTKEYVRYLAIAYAEGVLDNSGQVKSFKQTFQFVRDILSIDHSEDGQVNYASQTASEAYDYTSRLYRGMPTGRIIRKDMAYLNGSVKLIDYFKDALLDSSTDFIDRLVQGKYDPTNADHVAYLEEVLAKRKQRQKEKLPA